MLETILSFVGGPVASFFGGTAFRMIWGEFSAYFTRKQEHAQELARMKAQGELEDAAHKRRLEIMTAETSAKVEVIRVQESADVSRIEASAFEKAVEAIGRMTGIAWVDGWNAVIRPGLATWAMVMLTLNEFKLITMSDLAQNVATAVLGIYLADRSLSKRGK